LLKIDYKKWKADVVSKTDHNYGRYTKLTDQYNKKNFIFYNNYRLVIWNIVGENIVLSSDRDFNLIQFRWLKLEGNQLTGIRTSYGRNDNGVRMWKFCKVDLITLTEEAVDVPFTLHDNNSESDLDYVGLLISLNLY
jgi:hypothetical protein